MFEFIEAFDIYKEVKKVFYVSMVHYREPNRHTDVSAVILVFLQICFAKKKL